MFFKLLSIVILSVSTTWATPAAVSVDSVADSLAQQEAAALPIYNIDCSAYPNVCLNWCFYTQCHPNSSFTVTVDRNIGNRSKSYCASVNRCSATNTPTGLNKGWSKNPTTGLSCDEQPKNTNVEGGANAATRCMPAGENSGEGAKWGNFIKGMNNGDKVTVKLSTTCSTPAACVKGVAPGTTDSIRQL
ncbi:hypothetical protein BDZ97DRAFT_1921549 [Flammula alnicola]|nr:hypothetical protein BDZ97DRAFT_1921549 [Flammula alnicola]